MLLIYNVSSTLSTYFNPAPRQFLHASADLAHNGISVYTKDELVNEGF
jgi:hypothetical protein